MHRNRVLYQKTSNQVNLVLAPAGRKVYMGTCCQTPVTPLGFKRLLDTVFYIPVAPLGLKSCEYHFFYTPIAPLGLKKGLTVFLYTFRTAGAKDENRIRPKYFLSCHIRVSLRSIQRTYTMSSCSTCATITHGQWQHMSDTRTCAAIAQGCREE